ncbi:hypothetical protein [Mesorhizobium sp. L-2-11]|uniref:hypothetical protein n=1 Tax=Mesorhizobium sp. L-2-11 TaxID=2744521 RepID=UPI0019279D83|nr:hypothetical protein [Mesorhizobium sp. L-2-11]
MEDDRRRRILALRIRWFLTSASVGALAVARSTDGGASFTEVITPHGDNHDLWIDPVNPS